MQMQRLIANRPGPARRAAPIASAVFGLAAVCAACPVQAAVVLDKARIEVAFFPASLRTWTLLFHRPMTLADLRDQLRIQTVLERPGFRLALPGADAMPPRGATRQTPAFAAAQRQKPATGTPKASQEAVQSSGLIDVSYGLQALEERLGASASAQGDDNPETSVEAKADGPLSTYPVPKAQLESMRAHAAKLGLPTTAALDEVALPAKSDLAARHVGHPSIVDASEGTAMDPLLNKSYDLNSAKTIPTLR